MSRITFLSIAIVSLFAASAGAALVDVPLPGLLGSYPVSETIASRTVSFQLPAPPSVIHSVSFRISGTQTLGAITCEWGGPYDWPMQFSPEMYDAPHGYWTADTTPSVASGPFTVTATFTTSFPNTTWAFLLDGRAEVTLYGSPAGLVDLCFDNPVPPRGEITEAVVIVDGDFPIAVATSTWGRIKALYRP